MSNAFKSDLRRLNENHKAMVQRAVRKFAQDLKAIEEGSGDHVRGALRVKPLQSRPGIWELTWEAGDGRATFEYGTGRRPGMRHIVWRRVGSHSILTEP